MADARQKVVQGQTDSIEAKLLVDGDPTTLTGATCEIFSPSGTSLATPTPTNSSEVSTVSLSWDSATYPRDYYYRADFSLTHAGGTKLLKVYFDVVLRRFESSLVDQDILDVLPALKVPSASQDFSKYRDFAWRRIERQIINRLPNGMFIEDVAKPEEFMDAHIYGTVWKIFEARAFDGQGSYNWDSAEKYRALADQEVQACLNRLALDIEKNLLINEETETYNLSSIKLVR